MCLVTVVFCFPFNASDLHFKKMWSNTVNSNRKIQMMMLKYMIWKFNMLIWVIYFLPSVLKTLNRDWFVTTSNHDKKKSAAARQLFHETFTSWDHIHLVVKKKNHNILRNCYIFKTIFSQFPWSSQSSLSNTDNKIKLSVSFDTSAQTLCLGQIWIFQVNMFWLFQNHTSEVYFLHMSAL